MNANAIITVVRDVACLVVGIFGIVHQELTGHVSSALLAVYTTLLGIPGTIGLLQMLRGNHEFPGTTTRSSGSPESPSQAELP